MNEKNITAPSIRWHRAFATTIKYELGDYSDGITIETEHQLSKEALRIDVLVIEKDKNLIIEKNIGKIFKEHNIVEYKSPTDYLSIHDYNKVKGYAYLYSAFEAVDLNQITVTFLVPEITLNLRSYLMQDQGFNITLTDDGINYISDTSFSIQIIEQKKLSVDKNLFMNSLTNKPVIKNWDILIKEMISQGKPLKNNPLLETISQAAPIEFKEVISMQTDKVYREVMMELGGKIGLGDLNAQAKEIAKKMLNIGEGLEKIALITDLDIETIKTLK